MHICPLIRFSCLFTFIKTLCSFVCVEHSSADFGPTATIVPLARGIFTCLSSDFVFFTHRAELCRLPQVFPADAALCRPQVPTARIPSPRRKRRRPRGTSLKCPHLSPPVPQVLRHPLTRQEDKAWKINRTIWIILLTAYILY